MSETFEKLQMSDSFDIPAGCFTDTCAIKRGPAWACTCYTKELVPCTWINSESYSLYLFPVIYISLGLTLFNAIKVSLFTMDKFGGSNLSLIIWYQREYQVTQAITLTILTAWWFSIRMIICWAKHTPVYQYICV